jgi:hypothetical protein
LQPAARSQAHVLLIFFKEIHSIVLACYISQIPKVKSLLIHIFENGFGKAVVTHTTGERVRFARLSQSEILALVDDVIHSAI